MVPYFILFAIPAWFALGGAAKRAEASHPTKTPWSLIVVLYALAIGLRHEVGGDWFNYIENLTEIDSLDFSAVLSSRIGDPAYRILGWVSSPLGGIYFVNLICGTLFAIGLLRFCINQPAPWLALTVAAPYLVTVVAMGYTRQGVAIGITMLGLVSLSKEKIFRFFIWIFVAAAFHKSAIILIPMAIFSRGRKFAGSIFGVALMGPIIFMLFLQESVDNLITGYVDDGMESSGAFVRVMMNALPAGLYLIWRRKFNLSRADRSFWTWMCIGAIVFIPALAVSPSSTAVDRIALYFIPVQIFVWSRLHQAVSLGPRSERLIRQSIVSYSLLVLVVWLFFGVNSYAWLPYKFYPWEMLLSALS